MEYLLQQFFLLELAAIVGPILVALYIYERILRSAERAAEREHELRKLQIQEGIHVSNPKTFVELDKLQRQFSLIGMGIRGGWIPFVMMYVYSMTRTSISVNGETQEIGSWIPSIFVVAGLIIFYGFLFNKAFSLNTKIKDTEAEFTFETKENEG